MNRTVARTRISCWNDQPNYYEPIIHHRFWNCCFHSVSQVINITRGRIKVERKLCGYFSNRCVCVFFVCQKLVHPPISRYSKICNSSIFCEFTIITLRINLLIVFPYIYAWRVVFDVVVLTTDLLRNYLIMISSFSHQSRRTFATRKSAAMLFALSLISRKIHERSSRCEASLRDFYLQSDTWHVTARRIKAKRCEEARIAKVASCY